jgi:hypothetical protein
LCDRVEAITDWAKAEDVAFRARVLRIVDEASREVKENLFRQ